MQPSRRGTRGPKQFEVGLRRRAWRPTSYRPFGLGGRPPIGSRYAANLARLGPTMTRSAARNSTC